MHADGIFNTAHVFKFLFASLLFWATLHQVCKNVANLQNTNFWQICGKFYEIFQDLGLHSMCQNQKKTGFLKVCGSILDNFQKTSEKLTNFQKTSEKLTIFQKTSENLTNF